jgi:hypothetical protein
MDVLDINAWNLKINIKKKYITLKNVIFELAFKIFKML